MVVRVRFVGDVTTMVLNVPHPIPSGRDSSVGTTTPYGLDGPGIESRWVGEFCRTRPHRPWGRPSLLYNGYRVFPGGKVAGGVALTTHPHIAPRLTFTLLTWTIWRAPTNVSKWRMGYSEFKRLKKEKSCTCTPPLGLRGLF